MYDVFKVMWCVFAVIIFNLIKKKFKIISTVWYIIPENLTKLLWYYDLTFEIFKDLDILL